MDMKLQSESSVKGEGLNVSKLLSAIQRKLQMNMLESIAYSEGSLPEVTLVTSLLHDTQMAMASRCCTILTQKKISLILQSPMDGACSLFSSY
mmetsp:Transcript_5414/g.11981  ORF Transcript_5414/g.11981 Transcript_5414/m.11981 type:complete len:93 (-) Transcript_5414:1212-1490(-)